MSKLSKSSTKVLVWLYGANQAGQRPVVWDELAFLFPDMTESGRRSLLFQLQRKKLVSLDTLDGQRWLTITSHGIIEITDHFPALSPYRQDWAGEWSMVVFLDSPSFDPQFRFLRQLLVQARFGQLSRGVYLFPFQLPLAVAHQLSFYPGAVAVVKVSQWQRGDEKSVIGSLFSLTDLCNALSGVSKEIDGLLAIKMVEKELISQNSKQFSVVFDRLLSILEFDVGVHPRYFPQVPTSESLLVTLQQPFVL